MIVKDKTNITQFLQTVNVFPKIKNATYHNSGIF